MISICNGSLLYYDRGREVFACKDINLEVQPGEFLGILGPSGSGKSSLLYLLSGLKVPSSGRIEYKGNNLNYLSEKERAKIRLRDFGVVFQYPYLIGYLSAIENVLVGSPGIGTREQALDLLEQLGIGAKAHRKPHELSGGERQRVCVARALLGDRSVIFADEPTANLDHTNGVHVVELLVKNRNKGALVMVTHDPVMLEKADRIIQISDGQIVADGH